MEVLYAGEANWVCLILWDSPASRDERRKLEIKNQILKIIRFPTFSTELSSHKRLKKLEGYVPTQIPIHLGTQKF